MSNGIVIFLGNVVGSIISGVAVRLIYDAHKKRQDEKASVGFEQLSDPVVKRYLEVSK